MDEEQEFTGQCVGGPDDGNMITARVRVVKFVATVRRYLDGEGRPDWSDRYEGTYEWDAKYGVFHWRRKGD